jgi:hypothetical protein
MLLLYHLHSTLTNNTSRSPLPLQSHKQSTAAQPILPSTPRAPSDEKSTTKWVRGLLSNRCHPAMHSAQGKRLHLVNQVRRFLGAAVFAGCFSKAHRSCQPLLGKLTTNCL